MLSSGEKRFAVFNYIVLSLIMLITLYPLLFVLFASFSEPESLISHSGLLLWPLGFSTKAYERVLNNPDIHFGYVNTLFTVGVGTVLSLAVTILAAYALSRRDLPFRRFFNLFFVFTMFFSGGLIPFYLQVKGLGLSNSRFALILPVLMSTWNFFVMRTAFESVPEGLSEAAVIEGANDYQILFRITLPLSTATIAVIALFYGVGYWNDWFNAMMFLSDRRLYPLQLIIREILVMSSMPSMMVDVDFDALKAVQYTLKYATIIVATLPILLVYPFLQKYFVHGVMVGAMKG